MKQYRIIDIEDNNGGSDGRIIIVKANPVEDAPGFEHLTKMFGKRYYSYAVNETSDTEFFVFPYTDERINSLINQAKQADSEESFWTPLLNEFSFSNMMFPSGEIKLIHKHQSFKEKTSSPNVSTDLSFKEKSSSPNVHPDLFFIVAVHSAPDLDYGQIISVHAIPFSKLISTGIGDISFKGEDMEYFYLHPDNNIEQILSQKAKHWNLWRVNQKDYTIKNDYVLDVYQKKNYKHDIHLHNSLFGKSYTNILEFDKISADMRVNIVQLIDDCDKVDIQFSDLNDDILDKDVTAELPV